MTIMYATAYKNNDKITIDAGVYPTSELADAALLIQKFKHPSLDQFIVEVHIPA